MGFFDFLKALSGQEKITTAGVSYWAPKPISNAAYRNKREKERDLLEKRYDLSTVSGINSIPVPHHKASSTESTPSVTGKIEYYLMQKAGGYEKSGEIELALACYRKANELIVHVINRLSI